MDHCREAVKPAPTSPIDEVYQLAAEMGGMGFISTAECEIMRNSALINVNMPQAARRPASSGTSSPRRCASTATWPSAKRR
jgi:hypothetical protein